MELEFKNLANVKAEPARYKNPGIIKKKKIVHIHEEILVYLSLKKVI